MHGQYWRERESMAAVLALGLSNCIRLASCMLTPNGRGQSKRLAREDTCLHRPRSSAGSCILCFVAGFNLQIEGDTTKRQWPVFKCVPQNKQYIEKEREKRKCKCNKKISCIRKKKIEKIINLEAIFHFQKKKTKKKTIVQDLICT